MSSDSISDIPWSLGERKRWQITAELVTCSSLHIGSSEEMHVKGIEHDGESVAINAVVKGCDVEGRGNLPIIPGSTLKGKLRQWLVDQNADTSLMESVFGKEHDDREQDEKKKQGSGGRAEFHDARLCKTLTGKQPYPFWDEKRQTWITASTAIDRHTGSALHRHLHYAEAVPPGVVFKVVISGVMEDNDKNPEVDILLAALQVCRDSEIGISFGAGEADGMGRVQLCGAVEARFMDNDAVCDWLRSMEDAPVEHVAMAMDDTDCTRLLDEKEIQDRAAFVLEKAPDAPGQDLQLNLTLPFDGPFLVSDPVKKEKIDPDQPDLIPLRDNDGKPLLPASSLRGALRSQAERIVRTLGGHCCHPADPCPPLLEIKELDTLCPVCQVFGAAGWKTGLRIHTFKCVQVDRTENRQDFVAIDRFHGGGKDGAKFAVEHSEHPCFQGKITVSSRVKESSKGLLALVLRDLREGDVTLGFGANKGYGHLLTEAVRVENWDRLIPHITAFREHVAAELGGYPCAGTPEPASYDEFPLPVKPAETRPAQNTFHNPYHFIPVKPAKTDSWLPRKSFGKDELKESLPHHSHALYRQETQDGAGGDKIPLYHGRIICRLETETPLFIGAEDEKAEEQDPEKAKKVKNYRLNGDLAIPATSLRGMISSLAEAASNSAMRVLENGVLSFRKTADDPLKKIGMVVISKDEGSTKEQLSILHLIDYFKAIKLKDAYTNPAMMSFLEDKHSWSPNHNVVYYYKVGTVPSTKYAPGRTPGVLRILGKDAHRQKDLESKKHELFITVPLEYIDRQNNTFDFNQYIEDKKRNKLPVPEHVRERYQDLADERSRSQKSDQELKKDKDGTSTRWLPFHLKGAERERDETDRFCTLPLRHGDLVWYSIEGNNVAELSFSSIWRSRVEDARKLASKVGSFFPDQELLPFNPKRKHISPAELLFGFVEDFGKEKGEQSDQEDDKKKPLSFAGKVRVSAGVLPADAPDESDLLESKRITLKALSTPKPPSPALYFTRQKDAEGTGAISKQELTAKSHHAMGRKQYLHAQRHKDDPAAVQQLDKQGHPADNGIHTYPWKSLHPKDRPEMKVRVKPITKGTSFYFHLDFSNLTKWELGLLCFALRPNKAFRHKLGMGKPIGLGSVKIDLAALHAIDRKKRYAEDEPKDMRYNQGGWTDPNLRDELAKAGYEAPERGSVPDPKECREHFLKTIDPDIYRALDLLGNPQHVRQPVHYPQVKADAHGDESNIDIENENFSWFVDNDRDHHECLIPLDKDSDCLPLLTRKDKVVP